MSKRCWDLTPGSTVHYKEHVLIVVDFVENANEVYVAVLGVAEGISDWIKVSVPDLLSQNSPVLDTLITLYGKPKRCTQLK